MRRAPVDDSLARSLRAALDAPAASDQHPSEGALARYVAREMDADDVDRIEQHLAGCDSCASELVAVFAVEDEVAAQSTPIDATSASPAAAAGARSPGSNPGSRRPGHFENPNVTTARPRGRRSWLRIAAMLAVVVIGGVALAGNMLVGRLQPVLVGGLAGLLSRDVSGGATSIVLAGGPGIRLGDVAIAEDPQFGGSDFVKVSGATLRVDPGALLRGQVRGDVHLDQPVVHLLRDAQGRWNVESLSGKGKRARAELPPGTDVPDAVREKAAHDAKERAVRLTSASITDGVLEINDHGADGRNLTMRDVDLTYSSPDPLAAGAITLSGALGAETQRIALRGEIGPFEGGVKPRYRFDEVVLQSVPLTEIPGAPDDLSGRLTFKGALASEGSGIEAVVANASGDGDLGLVDGELRDRNLTAELIAALTRHGDGSGAAVEGAATSADILGRAERSPALAAVLAQDTTPFQDISGAVAIKGGNVSFKGLAVETSLFEASVMGSLSRAGEIEAVGTVALTPAATAAIVELLPEARRLFASGAKLEVPFSVVGTWPDVTLNVDVRTAIAKLAAPIDPRGLVLLRPARG